MVRNKILALVLIALAVGLLFFGSISAITPFLPGFEDLLLRSSEVIDVEQSPIMLGNPVIQAAVGFFVFVVPGFCAGVFGIWRWRRDVRRSREEQANVEERERWGDEALDRWTNQMLEACMRRIDLSALVDQGRLVIQPHLADFHARWMSRFLAALSGKTEGGVRVDSGASRSNRRVSLRVFVALLLSAAGFSALWGVLAFVMLTWFEWMPVLEQEVNAAMLVSTLSFPGAFTLFSSFLGVGLLRLDRQARMKEESERVRRRSLCVSLVEQAMAWAENFLSTGSETSLRLTSSLLVATLEVVDPVDRRTVLLHIYTRGLLRGDRPLDLRGANLGSVDLDGADLTGIRLLEARLDHAILSNAKLDQAILDGSSLRGARIQDTSLRGASLCSVSFAGASCQQACFLGADLRGASLAEANLWQAQLDHPSAATRTGE